jgi:hypothetical protein
MNPKYLTNICKDGHVRSLKVGFSPIQLVVTPPSIFFTRLP